MCHSYAVGFHGMALAIVVVADVCVIIVADLFLVRGRRCRHLEAFVF